jgi:hypothetical protein
MHAYLGATGQQRVIEGVRTTMAERAALSGM